MKFLTCLCYSPATSASASAVSVVVVVPDGDASGGGSYQGPALHVCSVRPRPHPLRAFQEAEKQNQYLR